MWRPIPISSLAIVAFMMACSSSIETAVKKEPLGLRLPSSIAQVFRSTVAVRDLASAPINTTLQVEGTVTQQAPLLEGALYQLQDATGSVWVLTTEPPPQVNATVRVTGVLQYESILVQGAEIGDYYLQESVRSLDVPVPSEIN